MTTQRINKDKDPLISARRLSEILRKSGALEGAPGAKSEPADPEVTAGLAEALELIESEPDRGTVLFHSDHGPTSTLLSFLEESAAGSIEDLRAGGKLNPVPDGGYEAKFDEHDLAGWIKSFFTWIGKLKKHPFETAPVRPDTVADRLRIAILGDWGSGRYGAPISAASIEAASPAFDLLLHLGDVYYSGTVKEVQERFLAFWPKVSGALSRALNSNHEMYSGGHGYFGHTLPQFGQSSSCFALENAHFRLVGLDTGYDEHDLGHGQPTWLEGQVLEAQAKGQRVVLFSHHQPFSAFEKQGDKLVGRIRPLLEAKRIFAWYWGHEHRCAIYERHAGWGLWGRLVGHGGFPYFRDKLANRRLVQANPDGSEWREVESDKAPKSIVLDGTNPYVVEDPGRYGPNGWFSLELDGPTIREKVHAPDGTVLWSNDLGAS